MGTRPSSLVSQGRLRPLTRASLVLGCVLAIVLLAVALPSAQEARFARQCTQLGGRLDRSTEDVEPLVVARTVYRCLGSDGQVLEQW